MADAQPSAQADERRFLTFRLDGRLYALPAEEVAEVIRMPAVARLPQSPQSLLGVTNLRGEVLPVASLRGLLGEAAGAPTADGRAIVLDGQAPVALAVDAVDAMVGVPADRLQADDTGLAAEPGERLRGVFESANGGEVAKVLDVRPLLERAFAPRARTAREARGARAEAGAGPADAGAAGEAGDKLVTFEVAGQEFGLPLAVINEIVAAPASVAIVPRAEAVLSGVMAWRDGLLPVLSLRLLLGFPAQAADPRSAKVLVVSIGGAQVGLLADRMRAIVTARPDEMEPAPAMLAARTGGESRIAEIWRGEGGRRLVSILAADQLFREDVMQRLGDSSRPAAPPAEDAQEQGEHLQVLVFRLGEEEFALPISAVEELARAPEQITRVPRTPAFLEGVINLRGEVLPVVDQRRRFDMPPAPAGTSRRLVVVRTERHRAGLLVDGVSEVLSTSAEAIGPAPDLTGEANGLIQGVINLETAGRLILLLDPAELLTRAERGLLDAFAQEDETASS